MAPKLHKKTSKKTSKESSSKNFPIYVYEKTTKENANEMNITTLILLTGDTYTLGPIRKVLK